MREEKSGEVRPGLYERERVQNYLELPNNFAIFFSSFFVKESNAAQTKPTPLFPNKVQTIAELIFFMTLIVITS